MSKQILSFVAATVFVTAGWARAQTGGGDTAATRPAKAARDVPTDAETSGQPPAPADGVAPKVTPTDIPSSESAASSRAVWRGYVGFESRAFNQSPAMSIQARNGFSLVAQPEFSYASGDRRHKINATFFARASVEPSAGSADVRELNWQYRGDGWSLLAGMNRVFWGATESRHLVDIVNQSDLREGFDADTKLGQAMVVASVQRSWGQLEFYALPMFRSRAFPTSTHRVRLQLPMADARVVDGSPVDMVGRVSISRGDVDVHAYYFRGVNREPNLIPVFDASGAPIALQPFYRHIGQFGADVQYSLRGWLFKGELMQRNTPDAGYQAGVGGVEYGIARLFGSASDLTLLSEYQFDNRPATEWPAPAVRGVYSGMRLAINDTRSSEAKAGVVYDVGSRGWLIKAEFTRRLSDRWGLYLGYAGFRHVDSSPALRDFYRDSHATITLRRYF
jgi:hypothetical protein